MTGEALKTDFNVFVTTQLPYLDLTTFVFGYIIDGKRKIFDRQSF
jgi:hypothetical protein